MNASNKKRILDMRKNARKRMRRKYLIRRAAVLLAGILILVLIIAGIRSCGKNKGYDGPVVTVLPGVAVPQSTKVPTSNAVGNVTAADVNQSYFADSCFVGNSMIEGMEIYELVDGADYFGKVGLNVTDALTEATDYGTVPVIDELNKGRSYRKIFMMFGENELNWTNIDKFKSDYSALIQKAKQYQPSAQIYLLSITPVSAEAEASGSEGATNESIIEFNEYIKEVAEANSAAYVDLFNALADDSGYLPAGAATDGIHFTEDYYAKFLVYIQVNYD